MSGQVSKLIQNSDVIQRIMKQRQPVRKTTSSEQTTSSAENSSNGNGGIKNGKNSRRAPISKIEIFSAVMLILLGVILLFLAYFHVDLIIIQQPPVPPIT
jgi:hypothetical protein